MILDKIPDFSSFDHATLKANYPDIGEWEIAEQLVLDDSQKQPYIYSRSYSIPKPIEAPYRVTQVQLDYPIDDNVHFYKLVVPFDVERLHSCGEFYRWQRSMQTYKLEVLRHDRPSSTISWSRAGVIPLPDELTVPTKVGLPTLIYPTVFPEIIITLSCGGALAVSVAVDNSPMLPTQPPDQGEVSLYDLDMQPLSGKVELYTYSSIKVKTTARKLIATLYGEQEARRMTLPSKMGHPLEEQVLIHRPDTPLSDRLKPPGYSHLPDGFGNNPGRAAVEVDMRNRSSKGWDDAGTVIY